VGRSFSVGSAGYVSALANVRPDLLCAARRRPRGGRGRRAPPARRVAAPPAEGDSCRGCPRLPGGLSCAARMTAPRVLTAGEAMALLDPAGDGPLVAGTALTLRVASAASNFAIAFSRLGVRVAWASRLGAGPLATRSWRRSRRRAWTRVSSGATPPRRRASASKWREHGRTHVVSRGRQGAVPLPGARARTRCGQPLHRLLRRPPRRRRLESSTTSSPMATSPATSRMRRHARPAAIRGFAGVVVLRARDGRIVSLKMEHDTVLSRRLFRPTSVKSGRSASRRPLGSSPR
jgi:hypothetical protein